MRKILIIIILLSFFGVVFAQGLELTAKQKEARILSMKKMTLKTLLRRKAVLEDELEKINAAIANLDSWINNNNK